MGVPGIFSIQLGGGKSRQLPSPSNASLQTFREAIELVVKDVKNYLEFEGVLVGLDNTDSLDLTTSLLDILRTFRDSLFSVPGVWWALIGQSSLYDLIKTRDKRISERISGTGIELEPLSFEVFEEAVLQRVELFSSGAINIAPLPSDIHRLLYDSFAAEVRAVLDYCSEICRRLFSSLLRRVAVVAPDEREEMFASDIAKIYINNQIKKQDAEEALKPIVADSLSKLSLNTAEVSVLREVAEKQIVDCEQFEQFGFSAAEDFEQIALAPLHERGVLRRWKEGGANSFVLTGDAALAKEFGLLEDLVFSK